MTSVADLTGRAVRADVVAIRTPEDAAQARAAVERLLRRPLTAQSAVQIALLDNRGLQAAYDELGVAEAAMVAASLPPSPTLSLQRLSGPVELEIERRIVADLLALATLPARSKIAAERFRAAQLRAAEETLRIAAETRRAFYRAVAARQIAAYLGQATASAETAARMAQRLGESGGMNKLDQAREQAFYAEMTAQRAAARQRSDSGRERLVRAMGLWGPDLAFTLPAALPPLPRRPLAMAAIEREAVKRRLDLQIARLELDALAKSYGLTQATRFVSALEVAGVGRTTKDKVAGSTVRDRGFEVSLEVPLFDFGEARTREAERTYMGAVNRLAQLAVDVRSQAREAYRAYRSTYDIAAHYQREVLPLRKIVSDELVLRYNAMMIDVFTLLADVRQRTDANVAAIEAQREFWLAATDLGTAVTGGGHGQ